MKVFAVDFSKRPDLFERRDGDWHVKSGVTADAAYDWLATEQHMVNRARQADKKAARRADNKAANLRAAIAAGSPTAVLRSLQPGESFTFGAYHNVSQISAVMYRVQDMLSVKFRTHLNAQHSLVVTRVDDPNDAAHGLT